MWDAWFDEYRDDDKDGIVQTEGMIECGCEDSPVFAKYYIVELPEINAELALLEEAIGDLAGMLDLSEEKEKWYIPVGLILLGPPIPICGIHSGCCPRRHIK